MTDVGDRREAPRARFSGIVLVQAEGFDISCVGGDVSETGMLLYPTRSPPVLPTRLRLTFALPGSSRWLVIAATLVRQRLLRRRTMWAVRFVDLDEETRSALQTYLAENAVSVVERQDRHEAELSRSGEADLPRASEALRAMPTEHDLEVAEERSGEVVLASIPTGPIEERYGGRTISIDAELPDPETVMLSSAEVDHLAAASLSTDLDGAPSPVAGELDDEPDTKVREATRGSRNDADPGSRGLP